jgi:uncharacterized protein YdiU (UPF0061 family)
VVRQRCALRIPGGPTRVLDIDRIVSVQQRFASGQFLDLDVSTRIQHFVPEQVAPLACPLLAEHYHTLQAGQLAAHFGDPREVMR